MSELDALVDAVRRRDPVRRLACPCGGAVVLGGRPAPRYTCAICGVVHETLGALAVVPETPR